MCIADNRFHPSLFNVRVLKRIILNSYYMELVLPENLVPGVQYRIHDNTDANTNNDSIGTYQFTTHEVDVEPTATFTNVNSSYPIFPPPPNGILPRHRIAGSVHYDISGFTFYKTATNIMLTRVIESKTGRQILGGNKSKNKKKRKRKKSRKC